MTPVPQLPAAAGSCSTATDRRRGRSVGWSAHTTVRRRWFGSSTARVACVRSTKVIAASVGCQWPGQHAPSLGLPSFSGGTLRWCASESSRSLGGRGPGPGPRRSARSRGPSSLAPGSPLGASVTQAARSGRDDRSPVGRRLPVPSLPVASPGQCAHWYRAACAAARALVTGARPGRPGCSS